MRTILLAVLVAGCGVEVTDSSPSTSSTDALDRTRGGIAHPKLPTKLTRPRLETRFELDFGRVAFFPGSASPSVRRLLVRNGGRQPLELTQLRLEASNASTRVDELCVGIGTGDSCAPVTSLRLDGGEERELVFVFRSQSETEKRWTLRAQTTDPRVPLASWTISATSASVPPCSFRIEPERLDLGAVEVGTSRVATLRACNLAPANSLGDVCFIDSFRVEGSAAFSTDSDGSPLVLAPQACGDVAVKASPRVLGAFQGSLLLRASDPTTPSLRIPLTASGR